MQACAFIGTHLLNASARMMKSLLKYLMTKPDLDPLQRLNAEQLRSLWADAL